MNTLLIILICFAVYVLSAFGTYMYCVISWLFDSLYEKGTEREPTMFKPRKKNYKI